MADQHNGVLRKVAWSELFPWLLLVRCFRIAIQPRQLLLGAAGMFLTACAWTVLGLVFSANLRVQAEIEPRASCPWRAATSPIPDGLSGPVQESPAADVPPLLKRHGLGGASSGWSEPFRAAGDPLWGSWEHLSRPLWQSFRFQDQPPAKAKPVQDATAPDGQARPPQDATAPDKEAEPQQSGTLSWVVFLILSGLSAIAVWGLFGGAITRSAVLQLATGQSDRLGATMRFAVSRWRAFVAAPIIPLAGVLILVIFIGLPGLLLLARAGVLVAAFLWPLLLVFGFFMAMILVGLAFGWPLMWASLSSDEGDSYEAVSNVFRYVYSRPLHYLFYAIVAALVGALGWLVVWHFTAGTVAATYWAASWGGSEDYVRGISEGGKGWFFLDQWGAWLICFWVGLVKLVGCGFLYSYFWSAVAGIYLLLRRDVDATEIDEVIPEEDVEQAPPLPEVRTDGAGAPVVDEGPQGPGEPAPEA